jgi:hypothetical protein
MQAGTGVLKMRGVFPPKVGKGPIASVLVGAILVSGTYLWQHTEVNQRQVALDRALSNGVATRTQATTLQGQLAGLQGRIDALTKNAEALRARIQQAGRTRQHAANQLRASEQRLRQAEARMTALLGAPLADGRYFGQLIAVGADQSPPRLVIDLEQWLTGDAAQQAEKEYGIPASDRYDNFIENESPAWHTVTIAPTASVFIINQSTGYSLKQVGTGLVGTTRISLGRFAKMMSLHRLYNPFWINVSNGQITTIQEEYTE